VPDWGGRRGPGNGCQRRGVVSATRCESQRTTSSRRIRSTPGAFSGTELSWRRRRSRRRNLVHSLWPIVAVVHGRVWSAGRDGSGRRAPHEGRVVGAPLVADCLPARGVVVAMARNVPRAGWPTKLPARRASFLDPRPAPIPTGDLSASSLARSSVTRGKDGASRHDRPARRRFPPCAHHVAAIRASHASLDPRPCTACTPLSACSTRAGDPVTELARLGDAVLLGGG
jgi:hypothetical protein